MYQLTQNIDKLQEMLEDIHLDVIWCWKHSNVECCDMQNAVQKDLNKLLSGEKTFIDPKVNFDWKRWCLPQN